MMRQFLFLGFIVALSGSVPAWADQNDPRLDTLFGNLQRTSSPSEAADVTEQIWDIWVVHENPDLNDQMIVGMRAMSVNRLVTALGIFNSIINADPTFAEGWNKRATVYYLMGKVAESLEDVEQTLSLEPRHFGALSGRGLLYTDTGDYPNALLAFEEALAVNPFMSSIEQRIQMLKTMIGESET
jgi:tetratricopeptide (TPR) repeat protein